MCVGAISWKSYKIKKIVLSSTEAEYVMVSDVARQAEYHKNLMVEMDLAPVDLCVAMLTDS